MLTLAVTISTAVTELDLHSHKRTTDIRSVKDRRDSGTAADENVSPSSSSEHIHSLLPPFLRDCTLGWPASEEEETDYLV